MKKHYHLIGIGGIGMSGIAKLLAAAGFKVSGSDLKMSSIAEELKASGIEVFIGHHPGNIKEAQTIIYSSAIKQDNPELVEAARLKLPVMKRAEALAGLMKDKTVIAVTGSHGKTTTTSLVSYLLIEAGLCPTVAVGGILKNISNNARNGRGSFFVAEADESDGSFLFYQPTFSLITNIDREHMDYYKNFENALSAFKQFLERTKANGCVYCNGDDLNLRKITADFNRRCIFFGMQKGSDISARNIAFDGLSSQFDCFIADKFLERFHLSLGGLHNIYNALAVIALALDLKIDKEVIKLALSNYRGTHRRLEVKFEGENYKLIDDYAHHPTELKASLSAVSNLRKKRLIAIFQPHRYSRTKLLLDEFGASFQLADCIIVTDIYPAGEEPLPGVSAENIYRAVKDNFPNKEILFLPKERISAEVLRLTQPGDLIITLGAGDITRVSDELAEGLRSKSKRAVEKIHDL